jgi:hypothetical protein
MHGSMNVKLINICTNQVEKSSLLDSRLTIEEDSLKTKYRQQKE